MDQVLAACKNKYGAALMRNIYELEVTPDDLPGMKMKIADIPMFIDIIRPPSGGLEIPGEIVSLLREELAVTQAELDDSKRRLPEIHAQAMGNLLKLLDEPSQF